MAEKSERRKGVVGGRVLEQERERLVTYFVSSRRRHTRCALVTGVQTCALPLGLGPPRAGAKRKVVEQVVDRRPRAVAYVACDPAALARDVAIFAEHGYRMTSLRAFDLFPMTHHVECVARLDPV